MDILRFFQRIRLPVLNEFMLLITEFGGEIAFLITAILVFWCFDKRKGYFIMSVGFLGTILTQFMKLWFRVPRPWIKEPGIAMEAAIGDAGGYSFPSGHSQSSVGTFGSLAFTAKNKIVRCVCLAVSVLVPISRMYVGVHTPLDVGVGVFISIVLIFAVYPLVYSKKPYAMPCLIGIMLLLSIAHICYVSLYSFPPDMDGANLIHGKENAYTMLGCITGMIIVYFVDVRWIKFETKAIWWAQIIKVVTGLAVILAVKSGLKSVLNAAFGDLLGRAVRYFLIVIFAGAIWPLTFRFFARFKSKKCS